MPVLSLNTYGQPGDTPHDRLSYLLNQLCTELDSGTTSDKARTLARQARDVVDGYDTYVERMSSPHPPILDTMVAATDARDWAALHREGKTKFFLIPEMSAGTYEAVVLQQLAKLTKVHFMLGRLGLTADIWETHRCEPFLRSGCSQALRRYPSL